MFRQNLSITSFIVASAALALGTGCFSPYQGKSGKRGSAYTQRQPVTGSTDPDAVITPPRPRLGSPTANLAGGVSAGDWTFMGPQVLASVIRRDLKVTESNPDAEAREVLTKLSESMPALGASNYAMGVRQNLGAEPMKFRALVEIAAQACYVGMKNPEVRDRFFPSVTVPNDWSLDSFEMLYVQLLGRSPMQMEKEILLNTVRAIPADVQPPTLKQLAAACAVVLGSVEFAHGR